MKMALYVNAERKENPGLKTAMDGIGYIIISTDELDEIDQVGKQSGKVLLIFDDSNFAYNFLCKNSFNGFETINCLYLRKMPVLNAVAEKKLKSVSLNILVEGDSKSLLDQIQSFEVSSEAEVDIQFAVHLDMEKEK